MNIISVSELRYSKATPPRKVVQFHCNSVLELDKIHDWMQEKNNDGYQFSAITRGNGHHYMTIYKEEDIDGLLIEFKILFG